MKNSIHIKKNYIQISILLISFILLYYPFISTMVSDWNENDNYSHGYLIPFISFYMIFSIRNELRKVDHTPSTLIGLLIILAGLFQLILSKIGTEYFLQRTSIIVVFFGIALFLWGKNVTKKISFPLCYLIFMIPIPAIIWNRIAFPLQLFSSFITEHVISMIGLPIFREGNILYLSETTLEVVDACSGLRSLLTMFALSGAIAFFSNHSFFKKFFLFFSAIPVAIFINIIRLTSTAIMAKWLGEKAAQGFLHEFSGFVVFILGLFMLFGVHFLISNFKSKKV